MKFDREFLLRTWIHEALGERFGLIAAQIGSSRLVSRSIATFYVIFSFYRRLLLVVIVILFRYSPIGALYSNMLLQTAFLITISATKVLKVDNLNRFNGIFGEYMVQTILFSLVPCTGNFILDPTHLDWVGNIIIGITIFKIAAFILIALVDAAHTYYNKVKAYFLRRKIKKALKQRQELNETIRKEQAIVLKDKQDKERQY